MSTNIRKNKGVA